MEGKQVGGDGGVQLRGFGLPIAQRRGEPPRRDAAETEIDDALLLSKLGKPRDVDVWGDPRLAPALNCRAPDDAGAEIALLDPLERS